MRTWLLEHFSEANGLQYLAEALLARGEQLILIDCTKGETYSGSSSSKIVFFGSQELGEKLRGQRVEFLGHDKFLAEHLEGFPFSLNPGERVNLLDIPGRLPELWQKFPGGFFIRPNSWKKEFSGQVVTPDNFAKTWKNLTFYVDGDLEVLLSPLQSLGREYRLLCVQGQLVTGSLYKDQGREVQTEVSVEPFQALFQEILKAGLLPDTECTVDVAEVAGELKLIEFNPLATSAIYRSNPHLLIEALLGRK